MTTEARTISPLGINLHIRLSKPADRSAGGVILPERLRENYVQGEILAVGPGMDLALMGLRSVVWPSPGETVLFEKHNLRLISKDEAVLPETDLLALVDATGLIPLNDWLMLELADWDRGTGRIVIAEEFQRRPRKGKLLAWGPGRLVTKGVRRGTRLSVPDMLQWNEEALQKGPVVHWHESSRVVDVGREHTEAVLVKAEDIVAVEVP